MAVFSDTAKNVTHNTYSRQQAVALKMTSRASKIRVKNAANQTRTRHQDAGKLFCSLISPCPFQTFISNASTGGNVHCSHHHYLLSIRPRRASTAGSYYPGMVLGLRAMMIRANPCCVLVAHHMCLGYKLDLTPSMRP